MEDKNINKRLNKKILQEKGSSKNNKSHQNKEIQLKTFQNNKMPTEETLKIESLNINGEGISFKDSIKYCVKGVLCEEIVKATPFFKKKNFINAELKQIISPNKNRISPPCPYYNKCGGCDFQFVDANFGLEIKKEIIKNYFSALYNKEIIAHPSGKNFNYRNKVSFFVKDGKVGLQKEETNNIVEIDNCLLLAPLLNKVLIILKEWASDNRTEPITHFVVRTLNEKIIVTVVSKKMPKNLDKLISGMKNAFLEANFGLYVNLNNSEDIILSDNFLHVFGLKNLNNKENNIKFSIHPHSFLQVNDDIRKKLFNNVLSKISSTETLIEGFSGAGLLSAMLTKKAKKVIGVEINKNATANANKIKEENNLNNLENINGDCKKILPLLIKEHPNATFIVDPPRSGVDNDTLQKIKQAKIKRIIYISCNPYTLKQNIVYLSDSYDVESLEIFDMFPQTFHIESLAVLNFKENLI